MIDRLEVDKISLLEVLDVLKEQHAYIPPPAVADSGDTEDRDVLHASAEESFLAHVLASVVAQAEKLTEMEERIEEI